MAIQTSFAEKVTRLQNTYDCFLAPLGNDGELDLALLDVKNRVRLARSPLPRTKPGSSQGNRGSSQAMITDSDAQNKYPGRGHADALYLASFLSHRARLV